MLHHVMHMRVYVNTACAFKAYVCTSSSFSVYIANLVCMNALLICA